MAKDRSRRKSSGDTEQQSVPVTPAVSRDVPTVSTDKPIVKEKHKTKRLELSSPEASSLVGHEKKKKKSSRSSSRSSSASAAAALQSPPAPPQSPLTDKKKRDKRKEAETAKTAVMADSQPMPVMAESSQGSSRKGRSKSAKKGSSSAPAPAPAPDSELVQSPVSSPKKAKKMHSSMAEENTPTYAAAAPETPPRVTPTSPVASVAKTSDAPKAKKKSRKKSDPPEKAAHNVAVAAAAAAANGVVAPGPTPQKRPHSSSVDPNSFNVAVEIVRADLKNPIKKHKAKKDTNASIPPPTPQTPPSRKEVLTSTPASTVAPTPRKRSTAGVSRRTGSSVKKAKGTADSETNSSSEEDDPDAMAALEWSEGFEPPSLEKIEEFWKDEHRKVAEDFAAAASTSLSEAPEPKTEKAGSSGEEGKKGEQALSLLPENPPSAMPSDAALVAGLLKSSEGDEDGDGEALRGVYLMFPSLAKTIAKLTETNAKLIEMITTRDEENTKLKEQLADAGSSAKRRKPAGSRASEGGRKAPVSTSAVVNKRAVAKGAASSKGPKTTSAVMTKSDGGEEPNGGGVRQTGDGGGIRDKDKDSDYEDSTDEESGNDGGGAVREAGKVGGAAVASSGSLPRERGLSQGVTSQKAAPQVAKLEAASKAKASPKVPLEKAKPRVASKATPQKKAAPEKAKPQATLRVPVKAEPKSKASSKSVRTANGKKGDDKDKKESEDEESSSDDSSSSSSSDSEDDDNKKCVQSLETQTKSQVTGAAGGKKENDDSSSSSSSDEDAGRVVVKADKAPVKMGKITVNGFKNGPNSSSSSSSSSSDEETEDESMEHKPGGGGGEDKKAAATHAGQHAKASSSDDEDNSSSSSDDY